MSKLEPLTVKEQEMAEQYFYLVDKFLRRKRLDPDKYYDVVIFGYLAAIQRECRNPNPPEKKNIYGLIEICMKRAVLMEWRHQYCDMRKGDRENLSLDLMLADMDDSGFSLYNIIADTQQNTAVQVEAQDLAERVLAVATPREREVVDLACLGYETHEIAQMLGITVYTASRILCNFRVKAKAVRDDREVIRCPQWVRDKKKLQAHNLAYRQAHRLELRTKSRAYYKAHKEEINARKRVMYAAKRAAQQSQMQEKSRPQC